MVGVFIDSELLTKADFLGITGVLLSSFTGPSMLMIEDYGLVYLCIKLTSSADPSPFLNATLIFILIAFAKRTAKLAIGDPETFADLEYLVIFFGRALILYNLVTVGASLGSLGMDMELIFLTCFVQPFAENYLRLARDLSLFPVSSDI